MLGCPKCGTDIDLSHKYCPECGNKVILDTRLLRLEEIFSNNLGEIDIMLNMSKEVRRKEILTAFRNSILDILTEEDDKE